MVNATSKVEKYSYYLAERLRPYTVGVEDVSVRLQPGDYEFIKKATFIDCSRPFKLTIDHLEQGERLSPLVPEPDTALFERLLKAWSASPFAVPDQLAEVREQWQQQGIEF